MQPRAELVSTYRDRPKSSPKPVSLPKPDLDFVSLSSFFVSYHPLSPKCAIIPFETDTIASMCVDAMKADNYPLPSSEVSP